MRRKINKFHMRQQSIKRLELHISYACRNDCIFCSEKDQLDKFNGIFIGKDEIFKILERAVKKNFSHVSFTGGEPTLHPDIEEILRFAKDHGLKTYISSNGGLFALKRFCQRTLPYLDEICLSIHGPYARMHNRHTRNCKSFNILRRAFLNIERSHQKIFLFSNTVITTYNIDFLPQIIGFLAQFKKLKQILLSCIAPDGNGFRYFNQLALPLGYVEKRISYLNQICQKRSITLRFFGVPLCILRDNEELSNDIHWSPRVTFELWEKNKKNYLKKTVSLQPNRNRVKVTSCGVCLREEYCGGIFKRYYQEFGGYELKPFANAR